MNDRRVVTNGYPKMGNHALVKALQLLGEPCDVNHIPYGETLPDGKHVFIKRDPRNALISWMRFVGKPVTEGMFVSTMRWLGRSNYRDDLAKYEGWLTDPATLVVCFEDLIASPAEMQRLASHLDIPYLDGAWEALPGLTRTWTGKLSDFREIWTPYVEGCWNAGDGAGILQWWGY
jgi:hypothetical protein